MAIVKTQEESDLQLVEQFFAERGLKAERLQEPPISKSSKAAMWLLFAN